MKGSHCAFQRPAEALVFCCLCSRHTSSLVLDVCFFSLPLFYFPLLLGFSFNLKLLVDTWEVVTQTQRSILKIIFQPHTLAGCRNLKQVKDISSVTS